MLVGPGLGRAQTSVAASGPPDDDEDEDELDEDAEDDEAPPPEDEDDVEEALGFASSALPHATAAASARGTMPENRSRTARIWRF